MIHDDSTLGILPLLDQTKAEWRYETKDLKDLNTMKYSEAFKSFYMIRCLFYDHFCGS